MKAPGVVAVLLAAALGLAGCNDAPSPFLQRTPTDWYIGPAEPSLLIVEYVDYECPPCSAARKVVEEVRRSRPDLGFVYRHFPTRNHPNAILAAEAAEAAGAQGQFWAMHELMLERQAEWYMRPDAGERFAGFAGELSLDVPRFQADLGSHRARQRVMDAKKLAGRVGVRGAPVFFVDGRRMRSPPIRAGDLMDEVRRAEERRRSAGQGWVRPRPNSRRLSAACECNRLALNPRPRR